MFVPGEIYRRRDLHNRDSRVETGSHRDPIALPDR